MDRLTNFILADAVETSAAATADAGANNATTNSPEAGGQQRRLGIVMIPGKHLVSVQRLES